VTPEDSPDEMQRSPTMYDTVAPTISDLSSSHLSSPSPYNCTCLGRKTSASIRLSLDETAAYLIVSISLRFVTRDEVFLTIECSNRDDTACRVAEC